MKLFSYPIAWLTGMPFLLKKKKKERKKLRKQLHRYLKQYEVLRASLSVTIPSMWTIWKMSFGWAAKANWVRQTQSVSFSRSLTAGGFQFNFVVIRGHALSDFNSFKSALFYGPENSVSWWMLYTCFKRLYRLQWLTLLLRCSVSLADF